MSVSISGEPVVITVQNSNGDFLKNLKSVKLGDDAVYGKGVEGSDAVYYVLSADNKTISLYNVKQGRPASFAASLAVAALPEAIASLASITR